MSEFHEVINKQQDKLDFFGGGFLELRTTETGSLCYPNPVKPRMAPDQVYTTWLHQVLCWEHHQSQTHLTNKSWFNSTATSWQGGLHETQIGPSRRLQLTRFSIIRWSPYFPQIDSNTSNVRVHQAQSISLTLTHQEEGQLITLHRHQVYLPCLVPAPETGPDGLPKWHNERGGETGGVVHIPSSTR